MESWTHFTTSTVSGFPEGSEFPRRPNLHPETKDTPTAKTAAKASKIEEVFILSYVSEIVQPPKPKFIEAN